MTAVAALGLSLCVTCKTVLRKSVDLPVGAAKRIIREMHTRSVPERWGSR